MKNWGLQTERKHWNDWWATQWIKPVFSMLFWVLVFFAYSQTESDSLTLLLQDKAPKEQIEWLSEKALAAISKDPLRSRVYTLKMIEIAKQNEWADEEAFGLKTLGNIFYLLGNYADAMSYFLDSYSLYFTLQDSASQSGLLGSMGLVLKETGEYQQSLDKYNQAEVIAEKSKDESTLSKIYNNKGVVYNHLEMWDSASHNFKKSLAIKQKSGDQRGVANSLVNLGNLEREQKSFDEAENYYKQALVIEQALGSNEGQAKCYNNLAGLYLDIGEMSLAKENALLGYNMATRLKTKLQIKESTRVLALVNAKSNQFEKAYNFWTEHMQAKDSLSNEEQARKLGRMESQLEMIKQQSMIQILEQENLLSKAQIERKNAERNTLIVGFIFLISISVFGLLYQRQRNKLKLELMSNEITQLRYEIRESSGKLTGKLKYNFEELNKLLVNPLSEREYDVLAQVFSQKSNTEIADELFISINTVKTHLKNVYSKIGVSNRKEAVELFE